MSLDLENADCIDNNLDSDVSMDDDDSIEEDNQVEKLMDEISADPYNYEKHLDLVSKLREGRNWGSLRDARYNLHKHFPLSPDIWKAWIEDELTLLEPDSLRSPILDLYEKAVSDYFDIDLWLNYCRLASDLATDESGLSRARAIYQRALQCAGFHFSNGHKLWQNYRYFLLEHKTTEGVDSTACDSEERSCLVQRVAASYEQQLTFPARTTRQLADEYEQYCQANCLPPDQKLLGCARHKILQDVERIVDLEQQLETALATEAKMTSRALVSQSYVADTPTDRTCRQSAATTTSVQIYQAYVSLLLQTDPCIYHAHFVCHVFERGVASNPLSVELWSAYLRYVDTPDSGHQMASQYAVQVYRRATRNVYWCASVWDGYMKAAERDGMRDCESPVDGDKGALSHVEEIFNSALSSGLQTAADYLTVWLAWLDFSRRCRTHLPRSDVMSALRSQFERACQHLAELFGLDGDPECVILRYWASLEALHGHLDRANTLWQDIISFDCASKSSIWLEYINMNKRYGSPKHVRKLFHRAIDRVTDWPPAIHEAWQQFEREYGTLDTWDDMFYVCRIRLKQFESDRKNARTNKFANFNRDKLFKRKQNNSKDKVGANSVVKIDQSAKTLKSNSCDNLPDEKCLRDKDGFKVPLSKIKDKIGKSEETEDSFASESKRQKVDALGDHSQDENTDSCGSHRPTTGACSDEHTLFLSNLDYSVDETQLRLALPARDDGKPFDVKAVRVVKNARGKGKGFAFIELSSKDDVNQMLTKDRFLINKRPCYVSKLRASSSEQNQFKFSNQIETNKLFIKGLSPTTSVDNLRSLFEKFGTLCDVRLVTYKNGNSKGIAYVEFESSNHASQAVISTDNQLLDGKKIKVAISDPPKRQPPSITSHSSAVSSQTNAGSRDKLFGRKEKIQFQPRSLLTASSSAKPKSGGLEKPKSNEDFRRLLLP